MWWKASHVRPAVASFLAKCYTPIEGFLDDPFALPSGTHVDIDLTLDRTKLEAEKCARKAQVDTGFNNLVISLTGLEDLWLPPNQVGRAIHPESRCISS